MGFCSAIRCALTGARNWKRAWFIVRSADGYDFVWSIATARDEDVVLLVKPNGTIVDAYGKCLTRRTMSHAI
jgi:hypothetical protein